MTTAPTDPMLDRLIDGRYQVTSRIARGGMATVYVANDLRLDRRVAIKIMHAHLADDEAFRERFVQEARSAARLAHPNVVSVFDQGQDSEMAYMVMEYLPGMTLRDLLKDYGRLTTEQTLDIMEAVLGGLAAAHKAGIVHRDVKPENVLLADDGRIKIGDFGLARAASANTATGQALLGTIAYLSPELLTRGVADARSDIYASGIMMYEMLVGEQPYKGEQPMQIAFQHANDTVPAPSVKNPAISMEVDALVLWATSRDPNQRPHDARAMLDELLDAEGAATASLAATAAMLRTSVMPADLFDEPGSSRSFASDESMDAETQVLNAANRDSSKQRAPKRRPQKLSRWDAAAGAGAAGAGAAGAAGVAGAGAAGGALIGAPVGGGAAGAAGAGGASGRAGGLPATPYPPLPPVSSQPLLPAGSPRPHRDNAGLGPLNPVDSLATKTRRRRRRGWWIFALVIVLVAAAGGTGWYFSSGPGGEITVPAVAGQTPEQAKAALAALGLATADASATSPTVPAGTVIGTDPSGTSSVHNGSTVSIITSAGPAMLPVPTLVGLSEGDAKQAITVAGFTPTDSQTQFSSTVDTGVVIAALGADGASLADPNTTYPEQRPIALVVSLGAIPGIDGMSADDANAALTAVGLVSTVGSTDYSDSVASGAVISHEVPADPVKPGATITLHVSKGPEPIPLPDVTTQSWSKAKATLQASGFTLAYNQLADLAPDAFTVRATDPAPGTPLTKGTKITVSFSGF